MRAPPRTSPLAAALLAVLAAAACDAPGAPPVDAASPAPDRPPAVDAPPPAADLGVPSTLVGPSGGTVSAAGATLVVPPGALDAPTRLAIVETDEPAPAGYTGYSRVFRLEPAGLALAAPAALTLPHRGDPALATVFASRPADGGGYARLGGLPTAASIVAPVTRLARAFVADGVDFTDAPARACARARVLDVRPAAPSGIGLFVSVDDCLGRPVAGLTAAELTPAEDGAAAGPAALLPTPGQQWFVTLSLDLRASARASLPAVIAAAEALLDGLVARHLPVQAGVEVFAGQAGVNAWQPHTLDLARVRERLRAAAAYPLAGAATGNVYGAVAQGVARLERAEAAFESRNGAGALAPGALVVFAGGGDTADRTGLDEAGAAARRGRNRVLLVALAGPELAAEAEAALRELAGEGLVVSAAEATLARDARYAAGRLARESARTYLLAYCSALRGGVHRVSVAVAGATEGRGGDAPVDAAGFADGCAPARWADACAGAQCGALGCGACDDRTAVCNVASRQCVDVCRQMNLCGGRLIVNALGYAQTCMDYGSIRGCGGRCTDVLSDARNCGACGFACAAGALCRNGDCVRCPPGMVGVPGATFALGQAGVSEPVHRVQVSGFCLDETEVTTAAYRACTAPGCTAAGAGTLCNGGVAGRDRHPINCVDWNQARAFCRARGADLPTEAQWELAARGADGRAFPWGDAAPAGQLCWSGVAMRDETCEVQSTPAGASPFGAYDLAGGVAEWVLDLSAPYVATTGFAPIDPTGPATGERRVLRGGSWVDTVPMYVRSAARDAGPPGYRNVNVGFRCARFAP